MDAEKRLTKAKITLIAEYPFFGRLCLLLKFKALKYVPTMGTDGKRLIYNPKFVDAVSDDQLLGLLAHEILHCSLGHIWRREKREPCRWNIAADIATNLLLRANGFSLPPGAPLVDKYRDKNAETIYEDLPEIKTCKFMKAGGGMSKEEEEEMSEGEAGSESGGDGGGGYS